MHFIPLLQIPLDRGGQHLQLSVTGCHRTAFNILNFIQPVHALDTLRKRGGNPNILTLPVHPKEGILVLIFRDGFFDSSRVVHQYQTVVHIVPHPGFRHIKIGYVFRKNRQVGAVAEHLPDAAQLLFVPFDSAVFQIFFFPLLLQLVNSLPVLFFNPR